MTNLYDAMAGSRLFRKFMVDDLLFVEYTCDPGGPRTDIWSHANYFTYVVSGKMALKTPEKEYLIQAGECYFVKKGGFIIPQFFEEVFCDLIIFLPDEFIRGVIDKYTIELTADEIDRVPEPVVPLDLDNVLTQYYQSLFSYFTKEKAPSSSLLKIKFEELIVSILTQSGNPALIGHFSAIHNATKPSITEIMEANFTSNLRLEEFARLSVRSLSTFRRDFKTAFGQPPGRWLTERRLAYSRHLLRTTDMPLDDILYESGFRNMSHFIRIFRQKYGLTPHQFRQS